MINTPNSPAACIRVIRTKCTSEPNPPAHVWGLLDELENTRRAEDWPRFTWALVELAACIAVRTHRPRVYILTLEGVAAVNTAAEIIPLDYTETIHPDPWA